jgi:hypothetical protein
MPEERKNSRVAALGPVWQVELAMTESENQFSLTREAPEVGERPKAISNQP